MNAGMISPSEPLRQPMPEQVRLADLLRSHYIGSREKKKKHKSLCGDVPYGSHRVAVMRALCKEACQVRSPLVKLRNSA
jgi:hypothetical protein